jgi:hypothetical protein
MRISIILAGLAATLLLSSCQTMTPEERRAADESTCRGYGFRSGTDAMARCLLDINLVNRDMFYRPVVVERRIIVDRRS